MADASDKAARYVPNECLAYIDYYRNNSSLDNLKKVVINLFTADEISVAKDVLWASVTGLGDKRNRRDSNARLHQDADLQDLYTAFKKVDELQLEAPIFVAQRLERLPRHGPEEINVFSLADRIATIERELATVKIDVNQVKSTSTPAQSSYASAAATSPATIPKSAGRFEVPIHHPAAPARGEAPPPARLQQQQRQQQQQRPMSANDAFNPVVHNRRNRRQERVTVVGTKQND